MTDNQHLLVTAGDIQHYVEAMDGEFWEHAANLPSLTEQQYREETPDVVTAAKANAEKATLPEVMGLLLAYADELYQRVEALQTPVEG